MSISEGYSGEKKRKLKGLEVKTSSAHLNIRCLCDSPGERAKCQVYFRGLEFRNPSGLQIWTGKSSACQKPETKDHKA